MLGVVAMSSPNALLTSSLTSEGSTLNDSNMNTTSVDLIKSETNHDEHEIHDNIKTIADDDDDDEGKNVYDHTLENKHSNISLKTESVKSDRTSSSSSSDRQQSPEIRVEEDNSPPPPRPSLQHKHGDTWIQQRPPPPPPPPLQPAPLALTLQPKKTFLTSDILGNLTSTSSPPPPSPHHQPNSSPNGVPPLPPSSTAFSMVSPNDSNLSSNGASPNSSNRGSIGSPANSVTSKTNSPMSSPPSSTFPQTPLLFQPFLPFTQQQPHQHTQYHHHHHQHRTHPNVPQMVQRALPFSIDNILKPTFGGRDDEASHHSVLASHPLFSPFLGASLASSILHQQSLLQQAAAHAVNAVVTAAAATSSSSKSKENSFSTNIRQQHNSAPFQPSTFSSRGIVSPSGSSLSSPRSPPYASSTLSPLSSNSATKSKVFKVKQEPPPPARSPEKGTLPKDAIVKKGSSNSNTNQPVDLSKTSGSDQNENQCKNEADDVPPGMVRGPNGQLWPAWVFCTRYSDRPSSGKLHYILLIGIEGLLAIQMPNFM